VPYTNAALGVSFSYPDGLAAPTVDSLGLHLPFRTGRIDIYRQQRPAVMTAAQLAAEHARTQPVRMVIDAQRMGSLAGLDAGFVQAHFDSSAGRYDRATYIVLTGSFQYVVACSTREGGHPVVPWADVEPICAKVLGTLQFSP
jgi:hypothetical protein